MFRSAMISTITELIGIVVLAIYIFNFTIEDVQYFWNPTGAVIVLGGTFASTFISFRAAQLEAFSPAFGMLGTLVGLIGMLGSLGSGDLGMLGKNMSIALITTVYGLMLANMIFKPIAIKLEQRTAQRVALMNVLLEGVILMRLGRGPATIADQMETLVATYRDEIHE